MQPFHIIYLSVKTRAAFLHGVWGCKVKKNILFAKFILEIKG